MIDCEKWDDIEAFHNPKEYKDFVKFIDEHLKEGTIQELEVLYPFSGFSLSLGERWVCKKNKKSISWRIVPPDYPFRGFFKRIGPIIELSVSKIKIDLIKLNLVKK